MIIDLPYVEQRAPNFCGPACLKMVFLHYGIKAKQRGLAQLANLGHNDAMPNKTMMDIALGYGMEARAHENASISEVKGYLKKCTPIIVNFIEPDNNEGHYAVVTGHAKGRLIMHDPWNGPNFTMTEKDFVKRWYAGFEKKKHWILVIERAAPKKTG